MWWNALLAPFQAILKPVTTIVEGWQARKSARLENELALAKAKTQGQIAMLQAGQAADIAWENTALTNAGIKDEVVMFVILAPMVACFVPGGPEIVRAGFQAMNDTLPKYWEWAFMATVSVSYGIRRVIDFASIMKGSKIPLLKSGQ